MQMLYQLSYPSTLLRPTLVHEAIFSGSCTNCPALLIHLMRYTELNYLKINSLKRATCERQRASP